MSYPELGIGFADLAGFLALIFIAITAILMFVKKRLFTKYPSQRGLFNKVHIALASLGGGFLLIHADYFIHAPISNFWIFLGYLSTAVALIVWFSGFSFLEKQKYSIIYHGSLSLAAISLMAIHSVELGFNISIWLSELVLASIVVITFSRAIQHGIKILVSVRDSK